MDQTKLKSKMELKSKLIKSGMHQSSGITLEFNKSDKDNIKKL